MQSAYCCSTNLLHHNYTLSIIFIKTLCFEISFGRTKSFSRKQCRPPAKPMQWNNAVEIDFVIIEDIIVIFILQQEVTPNLNRHS